MRRGSAACAAIVLACALAMVAGPATASAGGGACAGAGAQASEISLDRARHAVLCLVNRRRAAYGKPRLERRPDLREAAARHNRRMLERSCFAHECSGEAGVISRIANTGYLAGADVWKVGEVIGYERTVRDVVAAWMNEPVHRGALLDGQFRHVGIGLGRGAPVSGMSDRAHITYTLDFGFRHG